MESKFLFSFSGITALNGPWPPHSWGFLDHTQRRSTVGRTPLDEWTARHRDLYLTTHNTHNRQTSMPPVGFEATISAGERPQTYALDRAATGTGGINVKYLYIIQDLVGNNNNSITNSIFYLPKKSNQPEDGS